MSDDECGLSWNGFVLRGDRKSIDEAQRLIAADGRLKAIEEMIDRKELVRAGLEAARIATLEAALRPFAEAGEAHKVSSTIVAPEQWRAAAAALADAPGEKP